MLLTSGTVTSAKMMAERLPARAFHQYVPLDLPRAVKRFLDHWRPDLALFVESELWPNLILQSRARGIPLALVNARLSARSFRGWQRSSLARRMLGAFDVCLAQDKATLDASLHSAPTTSSSPAASRPTRRSFPSIARPAPRSATPRTAGHFSSPPARTRAKRRCFWMSRSSCARRMR